MSEIQQFVVPSLPHSIQPPSHEPLQIPNPILHASNESIELSDEDSDISETDDVDNNTGEQKPRTKWTIEQDNKLRESVQLHDGKNWKKIAYDAFGHSKTDVQCLHRWQKVLDPKLVKVCVDDTIFLNISQYTNISIYVYNMCGY